MSSIRLSEKLKGTRKCWDDMCAQTSDVIRKRGTEWVVKASEMYSAIEEGIASGKLSSECWSDGWKPKFDAFVGFITVPINQFLVANREVFKLLPLFSASRMMEETGFSIITANEFSPQQNSSSSRAIDGFLNLAATGDSLPTSQRLKEAVSLSPCSPVLVDIDYSLLT